MPDYEDVRIAIIRLKSGDQDLKRYMHQLVLQKGPRQYPILQETIKRNTLLSKEDTIFYKSVWLQTYADDINIIGFHNRAVGWTEWATEELSSSYTNDDQTPQFTHRSRPVVLCRNEDDDSSDELALGVFERKILSKIYGPFGMGGFRFWSDQH